MSAAASAFTESGIAGGRQKPPRVFITLSNDVTTAKTHLEHIFLKTGVTRQAELIGSQSTSVSTTTSPGRQGRRTAQEAVAALLIPPRKRRIDPAHHRLFLSHRTESSVHRALTKMLQHQTKQREVAR